MVEADISHDLPSVSWKTKENDGIASSSNLKSWEKGASMIEVLGQVKKLRSRSLEGPRTRVTTLWAGENGCLSSGMPWFCLYHVHVFYNLMQPSVWMRLFSFLGLSTQILTSSRNILTEIPSINVCASCCPVTLTQNEPLQYCILNTLNLQCLVLCKIIKISYGLGSWTSYLNILSLNWVGLSMLVVLLILMIVMLLILGSNQKVPYIFPVNSS